MFVSAFVFVFVFVFRFCFVGEEAGGREVDGRGDVFGFVLSRGRSRPSHALSLRIWSSLRLFR